MSMSLERAIQLVSKRYKDLGYIVPEIVYKKVNTFDKESGVGDFVPMAQSKNDNIIYVDNSAYGDLIKNTEAMFFYLAHELAHIITKQDHGGKKFEAAIIKYNNTYPNQKTSSEPDDSFNKKYIPTFYKLDKLLDANKKDEFLEQIRAMAGSSFNY